MSWFAVDDRFWSHRKVMRMRRSPAYSDAVALWTLSGSWCCSQDVERFTGKVPLDVLASFGVPGWRDGLDLLVDVGLWEVPDGDAAAFHDWGDWNGIDGREYRSKEKTRQRVEVYRRRKCERGEHDRHCPSDTCPKKIAKVRVTAGNATPGRDGTGRDGTQPQNSNEEEQEVTRNNSSKDDAWSADDPWVTADGEAPF
jgi:hypothetical protein